MTTKSSGVDQKQQAADTNTTTSSS